MTSAHFRAAQRELSHHLGESPRIVSPQVDQVDQDDQADWADQADRAEPCEMPVDGSR